MTIGLIFVMGRRRHHAARAPDARGGALFAAGAGGLLLAASYYFDEHVVLNLVYLPLALFLTYTGVVFYRVIFEQGRRGAARRPGQYLSPVVAHVTRDPDSLKLGGDQREMTVMFSDLEASPRSPRSSIRRRWSSSSTST